MTYIYYAYIFHWVLAATKYHKCTVMCTYIVTKLELALYCGGEVVELYEWMCGFGLLYAAVILQLDNYIDMVIRLQSSEHE